ncbi:MAG: ribonuclease R [Balneola sp.]|jgi:ribonuclease R|nr:ribonuclease R [Balneola sp.]MAO76858.1 ribonuclease R [Balneola sp.]MBF65015.1 ribonuclease R [Balneola sp.]|tara:strand:+ start:1650 stop:3806 length:2157 start_codon:yes stop_codon:yes gene_type:complete
MSRNSRESSLEQIIIDLVKSSPNNSLQRDVIANALAINSKKEYRKLDKAIGRLDKRGILSKNGSQIQLRTSHSKLKKENSNLVEGYIQLTPRGTGYVIVEGMEDDIMIPSNDTGLSLPNDIVSVKITGKKGSGQPKGKIVEILKRGKEFYVGTFKRTGDRTYIIEPDQKSAHINFFVLKDNINGAHNNDKVLFNLKNWTHPKALPEAEVISILGKSGTNDANILSILAENELKADFDDEVEKFADRIPVDIPEEEFKRRRDMRDEFVFTIDPADAKDFDDALSIKVLDNGNYYLGVHIADVSHYVTSDTILDKEAYSRGTSVYLVDRVIPMLPEKLSNGVCSLRPNEDKLTYSCFMEIDTSGNLINYSVEETAIHSKCRFSYEEAQEVLDGASHKHKKELKTAEKLAKTLHEKRFKEGAIDFDNPEPKFVLDAKGVPIDVIIKKRIFAHRLIEECMLMANKTVALHVENLRKESGKKKSKNLFPFFYRIHDKPDQEKLAGVAEQVAPFNIKFEVSENMSPKKINNLLQKVKNTPVESIVNGLMLRSMAKAEYSPANIGHFGLGFPHYAHFTSPIRRYPDVIVHRLLKKYSSGTTGISFEALTKHGEHCSTRERVAVDAERDSIKLKQVEFLSTKIGENFNGTITGVTERGIFVNLDDIHCEGMVRVSDLKGDYYVFNQKTHALIGRSSGRSYKLGDAIKVKVESTNTQKRQIDFSLAK